MENPAALGGSTPEKVPGGFSMSDTGGTGVVASWSSEGPPRADERAQSVEDPVALGDVLPSSSALSVVNPAAVGCPRAMCMPCVGDMAFLPPAGDHPIGLLHQLQDEHAVRGMSDCVCACVCCLSLRF